LQDGKPPSRDALLLFEEAISETYFFKVTVLDKITTAPKAGDKLTAIVISDNDPYDSLFARDMVPRCSLFP
jgi:hypothetical protein